MKRCLPLFALCALLLPVLTLRADDKPADTKPPVQPSDDGEEGFVSLWNGKDLSEWQIGKNAESWSVKDGEIVVHGKGPAHLFYEGPVENHDFKNFHLKADVLTFPHANSGIYFHTRYQEKGFPAFGFEAQVNNTHKDPRKTGSLYLMQDVMNTPPAQDGKWFLYEIIVQDKHVILKIDGKTTADWTQPTPPQPPKQWPERVLSHGTIALQGHDPGSEVHFKNIRIKVLPD